MPYKDIGRKRKFDLEKKAKRKRWVDKYKQEQGCNRCHENDPACLDFHHPNSDKEVGVSRLKSYAFKTMVEEIEKCIILCSNCHRKLHSYEKIVLIKEIMPWDKYASELSGNISGL